MCFVKQEEPGASIDGDSVFLQNVGTCLPKMHDITSLKTMISVFVPYCHTIYE